MGHTAPVVRFALAWAVGAGAGLLGAPWWFAPPMLALAIGVPIATAWRPPGDHSSLLIVVAAAGLLSSATPDADRRCAVRVVGARVSLDGRLLASLRSGSAPFVPNDGCAEFTVVATAEVSERAVAAGRPVRAIGVWRDGRRRPWLLARSVEAVDDTSHETRVDRVRWAVVAWRDALAGRIADLYGERAPIIAALLLARREGLDPSVRETFAVTGVAHLLAISGFHVGVVAGLALSLLRASGVGRRRSTLTAAALTWGYVALIGFPDAACRAALILTCVAVSHMRGRPPTRWGALGAAGLVLLVLDPARLGSPGFQLSFAGAAGLVAWAAPVGRAIEDVRRRCGAPPLPRALVSALSSGIAATVATAPIVAWHFERVSLIGVPVTLLATPLVSIALPGAIASVVADFIAPPVAHFLAGGVSSLVGALTALTEAGAGFPWASAAVGRPLVACVLTGTAVACRIAMRPGVGRRARRVLVVIYAAIAATAWPLVRAAEGRGSLEVWMIDVGQGDAIALRTPLGRWLLVDTGPPGEGGAAEHAVVRALRRRGVGRLAAMVLSHADADHTGGAVAVLERIDVDRVIDPALPVARSGYLEVLETARRRGVPWSAAREGQRLVLDGVEIRVLHPTVTAIEEQRGKSPALVEANASSVVLLVVWRDFRLLLTGDAYVDVERAIAQAAGDIDVLKVGHHGSRTSTDSLFLALTRPELAMISVGKRNRYGHPAPEVLARLEAAGAEIRRTDVEGSLRVVVDRDGRTVVRGER